MSALPLHGVRAHAREAVEVPVVGGDALVGVAPRVEDELTVRVERQVQLEIRINEDKLVKNIKSLK